MKVEKIYYGDMDVYTLLQLYNYFDENEDKEKECLNLMYENNYDKYIDKLLIEEFPLLKNIKYNFDFLGMLKIEDFDFVNVIYEVDNFFSEERKEPYKENFDYCGYYQDILEEIVENYDYIFTSKNILEKTDFVINLISDINEGKILKYIRNEDRFFSDISNILNRSCYYHYDRCFEYIKENIIELIKKFNYFLDCYNSHLREKIIELLKDYKYINKNIIFEITYNDDNLIEDFNIIKSQ